MAEDEEDDLILDKMIKIYKRKTDSTNPTDPTEPVDPYAKNPDMTDNRNSDGDVVLPYRYTKNGWDIEFNLDISQRVQNGLFLIKITPHATPGNIVPRAKLILSKATFEGDANRFNIYDANKNQYLPIGATKEFDLKFNMEQRKHAYSIGDWGDESYIYLFVDGHCSGVFFIFTKDSGGDYVRI